MKQTGMINHVEIYVSNLESSTQFWSWFLGRLGYSEFQKWNKGITTLYQDKRPSAGGPNSYVVFFEDPDRIKVELVGPC